MARGSIAKTCPHGTTGTAGKPACRVKHGTWSYMVDAGADPVHDIRRRLSRPSGALHGYCKARQLPG